MSKTTPPHRTWLLGAALALLTGACTDPLDPTAQQVEARAANVDTELNPQPEPPSMLMLPYSLTAVGRGVFEGTVGSCDVDATLELGDDPQGEVTPMRWSLQLEATDGAKFNAELSGILNWTTGHSVSNGVLTLPAVQFQLHEQGTFSADENGLTGFTGAVALNPQPEPPSYPPNPSQPPNPLGQNPCAVPADR
jgi:hypothetical protein